MSSSEFGHSDRRAFLASCATPLLMPWRLRTDETQQDTPVSWERAVDAYLERDLRLAVRVLEIPLASIRRQAQDSFERWMKGAFETRGLAGAADRRVAARRLQGSAALSVEILLPLSSVGPYEKGLRVLETIASDALDHAQEFEDPANLPEDRAGRPPEPLLRALAQFRARWHVALLQVLVNMQRLGDVLVVVSRIKLAPDDRAALAEMRFLRGLLAESVVRFNGAHQRLRQLGLPLADSDLTTTAPSSMMLSVGKRYDEASGWYRQALAARPDHPEARLHLGHLAVEGGRHDEALELLSPLDVPAVRRGIAGLARLFMAESHATRGAHDAALTAFEHAARIDEVRQSALMALTLLAMRSGELVRAEDLTKAFDVSDAPASDDADAWTAYVSGRRADSDAVLDLVREALLP